MRKVVLCADIGTSSLKAAFIDIERERNGSRLIALVRVMYAAQAEFISGVQPAQDLSPSAWECAFQKAVTGLYRQKPEITIAALCISGNGPTLVPVAKDGTALTTLHWYGKVKSDAALTSFFLPHVLWYQEKHPELFEKTARIFSCQEWLSFRLGAEPVTVLPTKDYTPYYWDAAQLEHSGLDNALFPPLVLMGTLCGVVSKSASARFGIPANIPIVTGGPDFIMALLGSGTVEPYRVCDRAGSSEGINVCIEASRKDKFCAHQGALRILPHALEGYWNVGAVIPESGSIFERWRAENGCLGDNYDELLTRILSADAPPHPTIHRMITQILDALALLKTAGLPVTTMCLSGGQAKSLRWNNYKAQATGCVLLAPEILDCELCGDAAVTMTALGDAATTREASELLVHIKNRFSP
ncbi:MAG: FGGY-family carbohydrate kinase [Spirochaetaceae bacterium]|jgi:xylulokinase|nr:FGGY-family carbohydrate kinase [Spirochaetaceae bacterium]